MAVAGRSGDETASNLAGTLREATFVRVIAAADGDSLAAAGLLAHALTERNIPFQASVRTERATMETDDTTTVLVGRDGPADCTIRGERSASETIFAACRDLGTDPNPVLALAGAFATGTIEGSTAFEAARKRGLIDRRPGIAIPVADTGDGLAHTTLAHAPFSGDEAATDALLDGRTFAEGDDGRRQTASLLALAVAGTEEATPRAAERVERVLRPYAIAEPHGDDERSAGVGFATVGGYADVLRATAHERPGVGLALALGHDARETALDAWRTHAKRAHTALQDATTERHRNVFVARVDADVPLATTARLLRDFRSPEPVALVLAGTDAAAAACEDIDLRGKMNEAATAAGGEGEGSARRGCARFNDAEKFLATFREAVA